MKSTPTTITATLIFISVSLLGVVVWIVKKQFEAQEKSGERLERVALSLERILNHLQIK